METWIPSEWYDDILDKIAVATQQSVCSKKPVNFYEAYWPGKIWAKNTAYQLGDFMASPTPNGFIYECITAGTSGGTEPGFATNQDATFTDGTVTWKAHANYSLVATAMAASDFVKSEIPNGKQLQVKEKVGVLIHKSGAIGYTALLDVTNKKVLHITKATSVLGTPLEKGNLTVFYTYNIKHIAEQ